MLPTRPIVLALIVAASLATGGSALATRPRPASGTLAIQLTDAPFLVEQVRSVDVFVVRVDARLSGVDSTSAMRGAPDDSAGAGGWITIATPNVRVNLLDYQYHVALPLGGARIPPGTYKGFRLVIDPSRSRLTLPNGRLLTSTTAPNVNFPDLARIGIKVVLREPVTVRAGRTTTLRIDFAVEESFTLRGATITDKGLDFHPVLRGAVQPR